MLIKKEEAAVLSHLGKVWQLGSMILIALILFIDPLRGRLYEWDWLQTLALCAGIAILLFSVWLDKFLNAIKELLEDM